jgi:hypothetical protein
MSTIEFIEDVRNTLKPYNRGLLEPKVEEKIRENVLDISSQLIRNQGTEKFIEITKLMQKDWKEALAQDIRFGREDDAQKAITKLLTLELVLSHPALKHNDQRTKL